LKTANRVTVLLTSIIIISVIVGAIILYGCSTSAASREDSFKTMQGQVFNTLGYAGTDSSGESFRDYVIVIEMTDTRGKPYYVGEIAPEFDTLLASLVENYNIDPATTKPITLQEARYSLTEDIAEATARSNWESTFMVFIRWCGSKADLVYANDIPNTDRLAGTAVARPPSNFRYTQFSEDFPLYVYRWVFEASVEQE